MADLVGVGQHCHPEATTLVLHVVAFDVGHVDRERVLAVQAIQRQERVRLGHHVRHRVPEHLVVVHNATQPLESRATPRHIISEGSSGPTYIASALQVAALELSDQHRRLRRRHSPKLNNPPLNKRRQLNT